MISGSISPRPGGFSLNVLLPALLPLIIALLMPTLGAPFLGSTLTLLAAGIFARQCTQFWGHPVDFPFEVQRWRRLVWWIPALVALILVLLSLIQNQAPSLLLSSMGFILTPVTLFLFLALVIQFIRLSIPTDMSRPRWYKSRYLILLILLFDLPGGIRFLIYFILTVWWFKFEGFSSLSGRERLKFAMPCLVGFLFLALLDFSPPIETTETGVRISSTFPTSYPLFSSTVPILPALLSRIRTLLLIFFMVLPGKILFRPLADWLRHSLRIRTKLILSYVLSSLIPGLLLIVILFFGFIFLMGGYYQRFVSQLLSAQAHSMLLLIEPQIARSMSSAEQFSDKLTARGMSTQFYKISQDNHLQMVLNFGLPLPRTPVFQAAYDSLGEKEFYGLAFFDSLVYLTQWKRQGSLIISLFTPFQQPELAALKSQCRTDLTLYDTEELRIDRVGWRGISIEVGDEKFSSLLTTRTDSFQYPFDGVSFPIVIAALRLDSNNVWTDYQGVLLGETSFRAIFANLLSAEYAVNRIYVILFIILAVILGGVLIFTSMIGIGLARGITRSVSQLNRGTLRLSQGDLDTHIEVKSRDELGQLADSFNRMVAELKRMLEEIKEKERLEGELDAARAIQRRLLPDQVPLLPGYDLAATSLPAKQVGGDYYDFFTLAPNQIGLVVGDVSGKGMPAALLMANLQASLHSLIESQLSPSRLVGRLNKVLHANTDPQMFATLFFCILELDSGLLRFVNAGHNQPLACGDSRLQQLSEGGLPLGVLANSDYQEGRWTLQCGELLVLYSDGVVEAMNGQEQEFGETRLVELLRQHCQKEAQTIMELVLAEVQAFCGVPQDDVTLMIIKRL